ncbi:hemicentin-2-like isoform X2 [Montipora foliosa]
MKYEKSGIVFYDSFSEKVVLLQRGTPSFMLLNLKMDDKAEYCCEVNTRPSANGMQGHSEVNCTQLIILGPPTITVISPNQTVNESNDVRLSCHASGTPPPSITWSKASNEEKTLNASTVLSLKNVNRNQDGLYLCTAINGHGKAIASVRVTVHYSPSITQSTKRYNVTEGHDVYLECTSDGKPPPVVTWTKIGGPIGSVPYPAHQRLAIMNANRTAAGTYMCTAVNGIGRAATATRDLDVFYPPRIISAQRNLTLNETQDLRLKCNASGNPKPDIIWTKIPYPSPLHSVEGVVIVKNTNKNESGVYQCRASNGIEEDAIATASVVINYAPTIFPWTKRYNVTEGDVAELYCMSDGRPSPRVKWTKIGAANDALVSHSDGRRLTIKYANRTDAGTYRCTAVNGIGQAASATRDLNVFYPPRIETTQSNQTLNESQDLRLKCNASGNPKPEIVWTKSPDSTPLDSVEGVLTIRSINKSDSGLYRCMASNGFGNDTIITTVIVNYAPSIKPLTRRYNVTEGDDVELDCIRVGRPHPLVSWAKINGKTYVTYQDDQRLTIKNINRTDAGTYRCTATNGIGKAATATRHVNVFYPPRVISTQTQHTVNDTQDVRLVCNASGNPLPEITWSKRHNSSLLNAHFGVLVIKTIKKTDSGEYQCNATNGIGEDAIAIFTVVVNYAPIINPLTKRFNVTEGNDVELDCISDGMPLPVVTWTKVGKVLNVSHSADGRISIINATRTDAGIYICTVTNGIGKPAKATRYLNVFYPPSIINTHSNHTVTEQQDLRLKCNASGNPQPEIIWTKTSNSTRLTTVGGVLVVKNVKNNDSGDYQCKASNGIGDDAISIVTIIVNYAPAINLPTKRYNVTEGNDVDLACTSHGKPLPIVTWTKISQASSDSYPSGQQLAITHANRTDAGTYVCTATNGIGKPANATRYLNVFYPPSIINTHSNHTVTEQQDLRLKCNATGNPQPEIIWTKISNSTRLTTVGGVLVVKNVKNNDSGDYQCKASNGIGDDAISIVTIIVNHAPAINPPTKRYNVTEGNHVDLECTSHGTPLPIVTWTKISQASSDSYPSGQRLAITHANRSDAGTYVCTATNGIGKSATARRYLNVFYPPSIIITHRNHTVTEQQDLRLKCNASGNPQPEIIWTKISNSTRLTTVGDVLVVKSVKNNDSGDYQCKASNGIGDDAISIVTIIVNHAPAINPPTKRYNVTEGNHVDLECTSHGTPLPIVTWTKISQASSDSYPSGQRLAITHANRSDAGTYVCTATNGIGKSATARRYLNVFYPPSIIITHRNHTVTEQQDLRLKCNASGNPQPEIIWTKISNSTRLTTVGDVLVVKSVKNNDSGDYQCKASNGIGDDAISIVTIIVNHAPAINPPTKRYNVTEGNHVDLECTSDGKPLPIVTWTKINQTSSDSYPSGQRLAITHANRTDAGTYVCTATNGIGKPANATRHLNVFYPPSIINTHSNHTVTEQQDLRLKCNATGNPQPEIIWTKISNSARLTTVGGVLVVKSVKNNDSGDYQCKASNGIGDDAISIVTIIVNYAPAINPPTKRYNVTEGNHVDLECTSDGKPLPIVTWTKINQTSSDSYPSGQRLAITHANRTDAGTYVCTATNGIGKPANATRHLNVFYPPSMIKRQDSPTVNETDDLRLVCNANGNPPPKITWTKRPSPSLLNSTDGVLVVKGAVKADSGYYQCKASNGIGEDAITTSSVMVNYKPRATNLTSNVEKMDNVFEGQTIKFFCSADSVPPAVYEFRFKREFLGYSKDGEFVIQSVNSSHKGEYECVPSNILGIGDIAAMSLNVLFPSLIDFISNHATANETDNITLFCNATGNPPANITWAFLNGSHPTNVTRGETLTLYNISRREAGTYQCTAGNGVMADARVNVHVTVNYKPEMKNNNTMEIWTWIDHETDVHCEARGVPLPDITWSRDGTVSSIVQSQSRVSTLKFTPKTSDDFGSLACTATNLMGSTTQRVILNMLAEPEAPLIVQINPGLNEMKIQWKESVTDPDAPVLEYLVQLREKNEQSMEWRSCTEMRKPLTCLMTGLRSGTMYTIRVRARNVVGYSAFTIKEAETTLDEATPTVGVTTTTEAEDERDEDDKTIRRFKDQSGFSIYAVLGGVIGTLVITIVVIARQRRKCGRATLNKTANKSLKDEENGHDNEACTENPAKKEEEDQV